MDQWRQDLNYHCPTDFDEVYCKTNGTVSGRHGRDRMVVGFITITTDVVSSNLYQGEVYNIV
jgi:hypothetical protein